MKKLLLITILTGLISTSAMAAVLGTVTGITIFGNDVVKVRVLPNAGGDSINRPLHGTTDSIKAMLATALTAKTTGSTVSLSGTSVDGALVWNIIAIQ